MKKIIVLDYGSGNLRSAQRALERVGARVEVTADPDAVLDCDGLAVPGVGPGTVERLDAGVLPHMGWNTVAAPPGSVLFAGIAPGTRFYFVHSYALRSPGAEQLAAAGALISWAEHGEPFAAAAEQGALAATQFHPEKSGDAGAALLANWLGTLS